MKAPQETAERKPGDYRGLIKPIWCPGCGDYGVLTALYRALSQRDLDPSQVVIVSGIGCSGRLPESVNAYGFHVVHGRTLPVAQGVKLANPELTVVAVAGDGDAFAIGGGHFPHAARRNIDLTYVVMDNSIYGLTKGQVSPTSQQDLVTRSTPFGSLELPVNPLALALISGASFVARGFSAKVAELSDLLVRATEHRGFAFIHVISPCATFHDTWKLWEGVVEQLPQDWDPTDREAALQKALDPSRAWLGILYQEEKPTYADQLDALSQRSRAADLSLDSLLDKYT